jgi:hypothetical protein
MFNCQQHPFAVNAFFKHSLVVTYAAPAEMLQPLIPPFLTLDTFGQQYGFLAAAFVDTKQLRPAGFPAFLGNNFVLAGFRIFVRYTSNSGKKLRGLYILKSLTNKKRMAILGNIFTHYQYKSGHLQMSNQNGAIEVSSHTFGIDVQVMQTANPALPPGSPFANWAQARRFAGPLPFTFTAAGTSKVLIVQGVRNHWLPTPVQLTRCTISDLTAMQIAGLQPASAFLVSDIPYHWKKGVLETWTTTADRH